MNAMGDVADGESQWLLREDSEAVADLAAAVPSPSVTAMHRSMRTRRSRADQQQDGEEDAASVTAATADTGAAPSAAADDRRRKRARPGTASASSSTARSAAASPLPTAPAPADDATPVTLTVADGITVQVQPMKRHDAQCAWSATVVGEWRTALENDGYLLLDGLVPRATVLDARRTVLHSLRQRGLIRSPTQSDNADDDDTTALAAVAVDPLAPTNLLSDLSLQQHPAVLAAVEHQRIFDLFGVLLQPDAKATSGAAAAAVTSGAVWTSEYKWLRGVPHGQCTGFHLDRVYMRGSTPLFSLWLPLGDLGAEHGSLVVCPGSHRSAQFARLRNEYGQSDAGAKGNGTTSGWIRVEQFTNEPVKWLSSPISAGSAILLDLSVLHCTSINTSSEYRLSCDTRWTVTHSSDQPPAASLRFRRQRKVPDQPSD